MKVVPLPPQRMTCRQGNRNSYMCRGYSRCRLTSNMIDIRPCSFQAM